MSDAINVPVPTETIVGVETSERARPVLASEIISENLRDYLDAVWGSMFPDPVAGQKEVIRRFLHTASQDGANTCRGKVQESNTVIGDLKKIHPFSDISMYDAICRMGQPWNATPAMIALDGKIGTYSGDSQAAARYTGLTLTPETEAIYLKGINLKALPKMLGKSGKIEPKYFIPAIPMALVYFNYTIGYAYQSKTMPLNFGAVCEIAALYAEHMVNTPWVPFDCSKHAELFLPDFPTKNILTNTPELLEAYRAGNFDARVKMDGILELAHDKIVIKTLPFGTNCGDLVKLLKSAYDVKGSVYDKLIATVTDLDSDDISVANIEVVLKKHADPFITMGEILKLFQISGSFVPNPYYRIPDTGEIAKLTYRHLLSIWYSARSSILLSTKRKAQQELIQRHHLAEAQYIVVDHMDFVVTTIRTAPTIPEAQQILMEKFNLTHDQAKALTSQRLEVLSKTSGEELKLLLENLKERIAELGNSFSRIGQEIADTARQIRRDFDKGRICPIPNYIGCVYLDHGFIQFAHTDELTDIADRFPKGRFEVTLYAGPYRKSVSPDSLTADLTVHKYGVGRIMSYKYDPNGRGTYTVVLKDGGAACIEGTVIDVSDTNTFQTRRHCLGITRAGKIERVDVKVDLTARKTVTKGAKSNLVTILPEYSKPFYLITLNDAEKNIVHIQEVTPGDKSVIFGAMGNLVIASTDRITDNFISIPATCLSRVAVRVIHIENIKKALAGKTQVRLDLSTQKVKRDPNIIYI